MNTTICDNIILMVPENRLDIVRYGFVLQCYTQKHESQLGTYKILLTVKILSLPNFLLTCMYKYRVVKKVSEIK